MKRTSLRVLVLGVAVFCLAATAMALLAFTPTEVSSQSATSVTGFLRPTLAEATTPEGQANRQQIQMVIQGILNALNNDGQGLDAFYLPDDAEVFYGPPAAGPELTRTVETNNGPVDVIQTGVVSGDQVVSSLSSCLAAFATAGVQVSVQPNDDLLIRTLGDLAYVNLTGANVTESTGEISTWRWSMVLENVVWPDGQQRWTVVHDHLSFS
jgi:hypothetical protein